MKKDTIPKAVHRAKDFIGAIDLVAGIPGDFTQNTGMDELLNILPGGLE